jgi:hypothetical protein
VGAKTEFLQIRVSRRQKAALRRLARQAGQDMSAFVLAKLLPETRERVREIVTGLGDVGPSDRRFYLAALNDLLADLGPHELSEAFADVDLGATSPLMANYVAAMVERAAADKGVEAPKWTCDVEPLDQPYFATDLKSLRPWLLVASPVVFKRRNIFIDATVGDRV